MNKIDWKSKLSSRKFWAAVITFVTTTCTAVGVSETITGKIILVVSGVGAMVIYIISEAIVDAARLRAGIQPSDIDQEVK